MTYLLFNINILFFLIIHKINISLHTKDFTSSTFYPVQGTTRFAGLTPAMPLHWDNSTYFAGIIYKMTSKICVLCKRKLKGTHLVDKWELSNQFFKQHDISFSIILNTTPCRITLIWSKLLILSSPSYSENINKEDTYHYPVA